MLPQESYWAGPHPFLCQQQALVLGGTNNEGLQGSVPALIILKWRLRGKKLIGRTDQFNSVKQFGTLGKHLIWKAKLSRKLFSLSASLSYQPLFWLPTPLSPSASWYNVTLLMVFPAEVLPVLWLQCQYFIVPCDFLYRSPRIGRTHCGIRSQKIIVLGNGPEDVLF